MDATTTIKGYELHERIGSGGFGVVHRAYQTTIGREVAIKIILPKFANHPDFIRCFEAEAQLIARLEHPFIVPLYDYWRDPDGAYLVMRWLRGGSLRDVLHKGAYEVDATAQLLDQITSALAAAHRHGVIHRDLKPSNILLDEDGNAYLADFGIAQEIGGASSSKTALSGILGSPDYIAPEQARREPVTPRTDLYSLGVMIYEMLAGEHPFPNATSVERMYKHLNDPLPMVTNLPDDISGDVNAVIQKVTAKNPARRYSDALEMMAAFREAAAIGLTEVGSTLIEQLTLREHEILQMITDGCSNQEIAQQLVIAVPTVKWHITQLYRKLHVRNRVQAIVRARELNLITPDTETESEQAISTATYITLPEPPNPYKGLRAFQTTDARDFFGRERLTQTLLDRLKEDDSLTRFLAVIGPSGSGKSSLVKAGLVPALWRGELPGSDRWFVVEMMPGPRPLDELEITLSRVAADQASNLREHLDRDAYGLLRIAGLILPADGSELVLIVDQFEEVFTLVDDEDIRGRFLELIRTAVIDNRSRVRVIVTLRADFYDRPLHYPAFGELVRERMETILPLSADELEAAVVKPAERVGVTFEEGLVATITAEVNYQPGALPLLQYALTELFERREGRTLTHTAYQTQGGAVGALAHRADELYQEQDEAGRETIRQMFLRLVTLGESTDDTRRRVHRSELIAIASNQDVMDEVIDTYAAYRLLSLDHDPVTRSPTVEVAHEALLREWERLQEWLNVSREEIRMQRQLATAAAGWYKADQDTSFLLHGSRLEQLERWAAETELALTQNERDYLAASNEERARQHDLERERQAREERLEHRARRVLQGLVAVFLIAAILSSGLALLALDERDKAQRESDVNRSMRLALNAERTSEVGETDLGLALALEAVKIDQPPSEAVQALRLVTLGAGTRAVLNGHTNGIKSVAFSPDSQLALSASCADLRADDICHDGEMILWDINSMSIVARFGGQASGGHTDWINCAVFSPDGQFILSGSGDLTLILWEAANQTIIRRFQGHLEGVNEVVFSPDGSAVLSGSDDATSILWDVETGTILQQFKGHTAPVKSVAFDPDGMEIASGSADATLRLWDLETGQETYRMESMSGITSLVFHPGVDPVGSIIHFISGANTIAWDLEANREIERDPERQRFSHATTSDGNIIVQGAAEDLVVFDSSDIGRWDAIAELSGHAGLPWSIAISPDDRFVLSGAADGSLRLWNLPNTGEIRRFGLNGVHGNHIAVSPDGRSLLTSTMTQGAILWDIATGTMLHRLDYNDQGVYVGNVDFSPDGRYALVSVADYIEGSGITNLTLWDVETGQFIREFAGQHKYLMAGAKFSPDGHTILSASMGYFENPYDGDLILWDVETGQPIRHFYVTDAPSQIAFSANGLYALTGSFSSNRLILWDVTTGEVVRHFEYATQESMGFAYTAFGPGEKTVLGAAFDGNVVEWHFETGEVLRLFEDTSTFDIDFSPDDRYMVASGKYVVLWNYETGEKLRRFGTHNSEWTAARFSADGHTIFSATALGSLIEWQVAEWPVDKLLQWAEDNRYIRELTCEERVRYRIDPLCE